MGAPLLSNHLTLLCTPGIFSNLPGVHGTSFPKAIVLLDHAIEHKLFSFYFVSALKSRTNENMTTLYKQNTKSYSDLPISSGRCKTGLI